ncbi:MAG TPA: DUF1697 domain-containing protein [Vicinamibacterales bacterium]|nr:DUF1697 domain-containing protein [Vicinamibacterales bacterium]
MTTYITVLRAINLGAHNRIAMADLRGMLVRLKLEDPKTLLLSGNAVFKSSAASSAALEQQLEAASTRHLKVTTDYFVRSAAEWQAIIKGNPFPDEAKSDPGHVLMMCLRDAPPPAAVKALQDRINGREVVRAKGRHAYFVYPDGIGRSKLTIAVIEKALGTRGTARNWNTVLKLGELALA